MEMTYAVQKEVSVFDVKTSEKVKIKTHMSGEIIMEVPGYEEATEIAMRVSAKTDDKGEIQKLNALDMTREIMSLCEKYVKKVEVVLDGPKKIKVLLLKDLGSFKEGRAIINDLFDTLISGFRLGND